MAQRFTLDRRSFEQFLAAASLVQQFQKQASRSPAQENFAQPLFELLETQKAIDSGALDQDSALERIVRLALRVVGGQGAAVWLFSNDEFVYRAGCGKPASRDERLRMMVLARVAAICDPSRESFPGQREWAKGAGDSGYYPGCVRSLIVGPIYRNQTVAGALAAFSTEFDAFDHRDASNIRLLSGLVGSAMERAAQQAAPDIALPRQEVLQLIEHIVPTLQRLVKQEDTARTVAQSLSDSLEQKPPLETSLPQAVAIEQSQISPANSPEAPLASPIHEPAEPIAEPVVPEAPPVESLSEAMSLKEELAKLSRNIAELEAAKESALNGREAEPPIESSIAEPREELSEISAADASNSAYADASNSASETMPVLSEDPELEPVRMDDDTAVPGIGVRAALYDDEQEPSLLASRMRDWTAASVRSISAAVANLFRASERAGSWLGSGLRNVGYRTRNLKTYRPQWSRLRTAKVTEAFHQARLLIADRTNRVRVQLSDRRPRLPHIPMDSARARAKQAGGFLQQVARATADSINALVRSLPDLPGFSAHGAQQQFRAAQASAAEALHTVSRNTVMLQRYRLRIRLNGQVLRRSASAFAVLLVMAAFLAMESGLFKPENTAAASGHAIETAKENSLGPSQGAVAESASNHQQTPPSKKLTLAAPAPSTSGPSSHRAITDPATEEIVLNLTRYEVATLRRQAASGDEEAAFQLGMAYETGYEMAQNCNKAAEWVTKAAEAGYPAAQYNLGLRYRDGDGVPADPTQAEKWLSKAASLKYRPARIALAAVRPQKAQ